MPPKPIDLTFFAWGDTHFGYQQGFWHNDLRWRIIDQMNHLVGWPYPERIGGCVTQPECVVHCGDVVDGGGAEGLELGYFRYYAAKLNFRQYEVLGNHDTVVVGFMDYFLAKYGAKSYSFTMRGIHCVSLSSAYDEREVGRVESTELEFLDKALSERDPETPTILFVHTRIDCMTNANEVLAVLKGRRVILVVSAHKHRPEAFELDGIPCLQVGHCRNHPIDPEYGRSFYVVHLAEDRLTAVPWRWDLGDWEGGQRWASPADRAKRFMLVKTL